MPDVETWTYNTGRVENLHVFRSKRTETIVRFVVSKLRTIRYGYTPVKIDRAKPPNRIYNVVGGIVNVHTLIKLDRSIRVE